MQYQNCGSQLKQCLEENLLNAYFRKEKSQISNPGILV